MPKTFSCIVPQCDTRSTSSIGFSLFKTTNSDAMKKLASQSKENSQSANTQQKEENRIKQKQNPHLQKLIEIIYKNVSSRFQVFSHTNRHFQGLFCF